MLGTSFRYSAARASCSLLSLPVPESVSRSSVNLSAGIEKGLQLKLQRRPVVAPDFEAGISWVV